MRSPNIETLPSLLQLRKVTFQLIFRARASYLLDFDDTGYENIVKMLLASGADVNTEKFNRHALDNALTFGNLIKKLKDRCESVAM